MSDTSIAVVSTAIGVAIGYFSFSPNYEPSYGESGLPRNCIAIVQENADGVRYGRFSPADALNSIERNCGKYGYSLRYR